MTETISFKNVYMTYIDNNPFKYPSIDVDTIILGTHADQDYVTTGWHIIPNFLWRHVLIPRQWMSLVMQSESYKVKSIKGTIYNPIPITTNLALQRVSQFSAFNNCTYAITYSDNNYETSWFPWYDVPRAEQLHLAQKEGLIWKGDMTSTASGNYYCARYQWPIYKWQRPNMLTVFDNVWSQGKVGGNGVFNVDATVDNTQPKLACPAGLFWDPFNDPDSIGELRAGKNSIDYTWHVASCDDHIWFNTDVIASYAQWTTDGPYTGIGRPWQLFMTNKMDPAYATTFGLAEANATDTSHPQGNLAYEDYTIPNMFNMPIVPTKTFWKEIQQSIIDWGETSQNNEPVPTYKKANKTYPGTEYECYTYSPAQWFCKGIPLYDAANNPIRTTTQVSFQIQITLEIKKRRSAYFCPTYGPISGEQLYTATNRRGIFQAPCIRYRTGGHRRTWQNMQTKLKFSNGTTNVSNIQVQNLTENARQDAYYWPFSASLAQSQYNAGHHPVGIPDDPSANKPGTTTRIFQPNIKIRWNKETDTTEITMEEDEEPKEPKKTNPISKLLQLK